MKSNFCKALPEGREMTTPRFSLYNYHPVKGIAVLCISNSPVQEGKLTWEINKENKSLNQQNRLHKGRGNFYKQGCDLK